MTITSSDLQNEINSFRQHTSQLEHDMYIKLTIDLRNLLNRHNEICLAADISGTCIAAMNLAAMSQVCIELARMRKD